jgi:MFS family permease
MNKPTTRDYLAVSIFWLAASFFWGAMLFVVLQTRVHSILRGEFPALGNEQLEAVVVSRLSQLLGIGALIAAITQVVAGAISDNISSRFGRRKPFLVVGVLLSSIGIAVLPFAPTYSMLFGLFVFIQLTLNIATGPYQALLPELIPAAYHGAASAYMGLWALLGRTGGMVAGALLMRTSFGLTALTIIFLISLNGFMILSAVMLRETPIDKGQQVQSAAGAVRSSLRGLWQTQLKAHPAFVWLLVSRFVINSGVYTMMPFLQYYLINVFSLGRDQALKQQAILALVVNLAGMIGTFPAGKASDRWSKKRVFAVTCGICVAGGLAFAVAGSLTFAAIAAAVFGVGYGAFQAVEWAFVCNVMPSEDQAKYMGIWSFADTIPQTTAPVIGGVLASWAIARFGSADGYRVTMLSAVIWFLLGALLIGFVREKRVMPQPADPDALELA